ncbi:hypothetical protein [Caloranaerobacter sp. DY30410]|uniref:hypothetical protein n=1 Tax=Caloranaerobacter sp. DY30410 TaxID=3238305 RepID=UPI003D01BAFB
MKLLEIDIRIDSLIIGERIKGGVFRPCQSTIPSSTIEGAFKYYFGLNISAVGFLEEGSYEVDEFIYSVRDKALNISKMPIITQYLKPKNSKIKAKIYLPFEKDLEIKTNLKNAKIQIGALKSKDFGKAEIVNVKEFESKVKQGILKVKLFEDEVEKFGIRIISPLFGYLFEPDDFLVEGFYKRALFPGSLVEAPEVLLKEVTYYDE